MAKITINRLLETSKIMATEVGRQIPFFFEYMSDFINQTVTALRGGLTFSDNFACEVRNVALKHNELQIVSATKPVTGIIPVRVVSQTAGLDSFAWFYNDQGQLSAKATFTGSPTAALDVTLVILF